MPTYTFHCQSCGHNTDVIGPMKVGAPKGVSCGTCGSPGVYRLYKNVMATPDWEPYKVSTLQDFDAPDPRNSSPVVRSRRDLQRVLDQQEKHLGVKLEMM